MTKSIADILIVGGGITGITLGLEIKRRFPDQSIIIIDKEKDCGLHASSRNSGVLHAGFYYTADSLKAQLTSKGNQLLQEYCLNRKLDLNQCGKLVVASNENELIVLDELIARGKQNNVDLQLISAEEAKEIEPRVKTFQRAVFSPSTASVNPKQVMTRLIQEARDVGIGIHTDTQFLRTTNGHIYTNRGVYKTGYTINTAGLYADKIAHQFGYAKNYRVLPFKGIYLHSNGPPNTLRTHVYPVPNPNNPFLGVHITVTVDQQYKIGPTAIPVLWREQYQGLDNFRWREFVEVVSTNIGLLLYNRFNFVQLAIGELKMYQQNKLIEMANILVDGVDSTKINFCTKPGIRAQLIDLNNRKLVMDFCYEGDDKSFHLLNAVSPAFTCALSLAEFCADKIEECVH
ncbi:MAG: NAD(P)/FAD-dependent oxidoreductase [Thiohalomonadales bacterium]